MEQHKTPDKKKRLIEALSLNGSNIYKSCEAVGVSLSSFYEWKKKDPEFAKAYEETLTHQFDFVESKLFNLIKNENPKAIIYWLRCKGADKGYIERNQLDVNTNEPFQIQINNEQ